MDTATQSNAQASASKLKAFENKINAQVEEAKSTLDQYEAKAKDKRAQAETTAINHLKTAKQDIDRKLQALKTTRDTHTARAKSEIESDVAKFKASIDELGAKFKTTKKRTSTTTGKREGAAMRSEAVTVRTVVLLAVALTLGVGVVGLRAAAKSETLIYAVYDGQATAGQVLKTLRSAQGSATGERIESYAVVTKDVKGKVTVLDQRKSDATVGAVLGGIIGLVGGPVGVAAGAAAGGAVGFLTGDAVGIPRDKVESMKSSLTPNSSALVVVLDDRWVQEAEKGLNQAHARALIASQIASGQKKQ